MLRPSNSLLVVLLVSSVAIAAGRAAAQTYLLEVQTGGPGTVTPGTILVPAGGSQTFTFTPAPGCNGVIDVTVDDVSVGSGLTEYTFTNVQSDHVLYVSFGSPRPTTTTLDIRPVFGQCAVPDTLTATVASANGGQVKFFNGATLIGTQTLSSGVATHIIPAGLAAGSYSFSASYAGTSCYAASNSHAVSYDVAETDPTSVTLTVSTPRTAFIHNVVNVSMTLRVDGSVARQSGLATFYDGGTSLGGAVAMVNGYSSVSFQPATYGVHVITAVVEWLCPAISASEPETLFVPDDRPPVDTSLWVTNSRVNSIVSDGGTLYIGGEFTRVGPATGSAVAIDASTGSAQQPYPKVLGTVSQVASDGNGGWYLGGSFTAVGGQLRNNLAHLDAAGNLTAWNPNPDGSVNSLAVMGSTVYAGGYFSTIGRQPRSNIAALDAATGDATAWNPSANYYLSCLTVSGGKVYVGGAFTHIGGQSRNYIAALDTITGAATAWDPNSGGIAYGVSVNAIAVSGSTVYAGGAFTRVGSQQLLQVRNRIAAFDVATGATTAFDPNANSYVYALAVSGGKVYAAGDFTSIGGQVRNRIAALDPTTGAATGWDPNASVEYGSVVHALALSGNTVYAGGQFSTIGGQPRSNIAALDVATGAATAWNPDANLKVGALAVSGGMVYAAGSFTSMGGHVRNHIAALDAVTGAITAWNPNADGSVVTLAINGGTVYVGGNFTSIGGQLRTNIAALDAVSSAATAWNANANDDVRALAVSGGTVYVGGDFTAIGGQSRNNIAALDAETGVATAWDPNANGSVAALAISGGIVYVGGSFTTIGGQLRNNLAALDAATDAATIWDPSPNGRVLALAVSGDKLYVGGSFTMAVYLARNNLAAFDIATGDMTDWNPDAHLDYYDPYVPDPIVYAVAANGSTVYVGGHFNVVGGQQRNRIAAVDAMTGATIAWAPNASGNPYPTVFALAVSGSKVYAGGQFASIGGQPQSYFAAIYAPPFGPVSVNQQATPSRSELTRLSPNPTSGGTQMQYAVACAGRVRIEVLDVSGRIEETLVDRIHTPGRYVLTWDGVGRRGRTSPGVYFVRLAAPDQMKTRKLAIIQ